MIEDEDLGLRVAESREENLWARANSRSKQRLKDLEDSLEIEKAFFELTEAKLKEAEINNEMPE